MPTFARVDLAFERGEGVWLIATDGERYLDFCSGVAVNALGHSHPQLVAALEEQARKVWHVSNLYEIPEGERAAKRLCEASFADYAFFCNSGAEAMECAIKVARKYQAASGKPERYRIITFEGSFHGRTLATLAAAGQKKYLDGFGPEVDGFDHMPFGDLEAVKRAIGPETAAILIEPLMGEGGVRVVEPSFLRALRALCDQHGLMLIFDEVQSGMGRTGELFTAFIGPSGCGKSTLLRVLNRMYDLYPHQRATGEVMFDGGNILSPKQDLNLLRARIGMVFQKPTPFPMTIYENIAFGIRLYERLPKSELDGRVETSLRRAALWEEVKDKLGTNGLSLSGGQQQRLCIARTVAVRPEVILFDEPCSALDPISTAKIEELIDELTDDYTIVIVTHNMQQAARVSDFTAFMYLGELIEFDSTSKMFTAPHDQRTQDYITGRFG